MVALLLAPPLWAQEDNEAVVSKILDQFDREDAPDQDMFLSSDIAPFAQIEPETPDSRTLGDTPSAYSGTPIMVTRYNSNRQDVTIEVLDLKDMEINDVFKLISKKSGLNIVAGNNVRGKVTVYLKNVGAREALKIILEANNLAYTEDNGVIRVMTPADFETMNGRKFGEQTQTQVVSLKHTHVADVLDLFTQMKSNLGKVMSDDKSNTLVLTDTPERLKVMLQLLAEVDVPTTTKVFPLAYAKAEDLAEKLGEVLTKNVGRLKFDKRSNKLVVTDTARKIEEVERVIMEFDEKEREVLIEAKIVQIVLSDQYKMGVDWQAIVADYHSLSLTSGFDILQSSDKSGQLSIGTIAQDDYTSLVEALNTVGMTNILSSPRITVVNNQEAKILVGTTQPYVTTTTTTPATGASTTAESVNFIEVGVKLFVTPTIHPDDFITMKIKPEVSSVTQFLTTSNNNTIPIVDTSEAETTVMVKDGVTIVIGGLIKDEKVDKVNKVPLLGDLPLLGGAFRNTDNLTKKTELVIFLTPQIITGDVYPKATPRERSLQTSLY